MGSARAAQSALVSRKRSFRLYRILYPETYCMNLNLYRCLILYVRRTITAASVLPISMVNGQWSKLKKCKKCCGFISCSVSIISRALLVVRIVA
jgi:hypothetical protein